MAEYIKREAALEIVKRTSGDYASAFAELIKLPAADVEPVRHGRWVDNGSSGFMLSSCSVCGFAYRVCNFLYCPHCGAKMDEVSE